MEVIPKEPLWRLISLGFLHVCGGDPIPPVFVAIRLRFSPRMWRWSYQPPRYQLCNLVFSTYVEVILILVHTSIMWWGFLHVCGGDPMTTLTVPTVKLFSPRMWRWSWEFWNQRGHYFVFSTYVEVIPKRWILQIMTDRFLHVCGGDPVVVLIRCWSG